MMGRRSDQGSLFGAQVHYLDFVGADSFYGFLAAHGRELFSDNAFADLYCADNGRPSIPPSLLAVALQHGYGPSSMFDSKPLDLIVPNSAGKEHYLVRNFANEYSGPISLAAATIGSQCPYSAMPTERRLKYCRMYSA